MRHSDKLAKKGKTLKIVGRIGGFLLPVPFVWGAMERRGAEIETTAKLFKLEELAQILVDAINDDPELAQEFGEELKTANSNPEIINDLINNALKKRGENPEENESSEE